MFPEKGTIPGSHEEFTAGNGVSSNLQGAGNGNLDSHPPAEPVPLAGNPEHLGSPVCHRAVSCGQGRTGSPAGTNPAHRGDSNNPAGGPCREAHFPGPALYSQVRLGLHGQPYRLYKIRSMVHDCERTSGARWSIPGDPITLVGRVLRKTHIDELPQSVEYPQARSSLVGPPRNGPSSCRSWRRVSPIIVPGWRCGPVSAVWPRSSCRPILT